MGAHGTNYTFFDGVETIETYGTDDRRGPAFRRIPTSDDGRVGECTRLADFVTVTLLPWRR